MPIKKGYDQVNKTYYGFPLTWIKEAQENLVMSKSKVPSSFFAKDWAEAFVSLVYEKPEIAINIEIMTEWFASALIRGYDEHARIATLKREIVEEEATGV